MSSSSSNSSADGTSPETPAAGPAAAPAVAAAGPDSSEATVKLAVFCPSRPLQPGADVADLHELHALPEKLEVPARIAVRELKSRLEETFPGSPLASAQSLLWRGRRLRDDEVLATIVQGVQQPEVGYVLHLTCPADQWKQPPHASCTTTTASPSNIKSTSSGTAAQRLSALSSSLNTPGQLNTASNSSVMISSLPLPGSPVVVPPNSSGMDPTAPLQDQVSPVSTSGVASGWNLPSTHHRMAPWQTFTTHLEPLSLGQRADFIGRLARADRYYATLEQLAAERQGPHMAPIGMDTLHNLREQGAIGLGFSPQSPEELDASIEVLLDDLDLLSGVRTVEEQAAKEFDDFAAIQSGLLAGSSTSQVVNIGGLPFLLQIPPELAIPLADRRQGFVQMRKYQMIRSILSTMLAIARTHSIAKDMPPQSHTARHRFAERIPPVGAGAQQRPPVPGMAMQQDLPNGFRAPRGVGALGIGAQAAARLAGPGMPTARLAVVINLDEILAMAMPLLFLSVKLAFLIYVFGKHATRSKRIAMCAMALAWVVWEGITIRRRRRAAGLRRQQQQQQRGENGAAARQQDARQDRRQDRVRPVALDPPLDLDGQARGGAEGQAEQQLNQQQQYLPPALAQLRDRVAQDANQNVARRQAHGLDNRDDLANNPQNSRPAGSSSRSSSARQPNKLSPKYWLYQIAKIGIASEAREMGLSRTALRNLQAAHRQASLSSGQATDPQNEYTLQSGHALYQARGMTPRRAFRNLYIALALFVGTLIPEVERLRRKALLKREKKLAEVQLSQRQLRLTRLETELARLEEERRTLENELGSSPGLDRKVTQAQAGANTSHPPPSHTERLPLNASSSDDDDGNPNMATAGPNEDDQMWDPPFDRASIRRALTQGTPIENDESKDGTETEAADQRTAQVQASTSVAGPPSIRIDTSSETRNAYLSPNQMPPGRGADGNVIEDDMSAPSTPLLSPAEADTEEEDERPDGLDDDVGM